MMMSAPPPAFLPVFCGHIHNNISYVVSYVSYFTTYNTTLARTIHTPCSLLHIMASASLLLLTKDGNHRRPIIPHMTHGCSPALLLAPSSITAVAGSSSTAVGVGGGGGGAGGISTVGGASSVIVHPMGLLSVLDHHTRRQEGSGRVIGTLLGKREGDRVSRWYIYIL